MNTLEDLHTLIRLLSEFELPVSPILDYAIKEREEQFIKAVSFNEDSVSVCEPKLESSINKELEDYCKEFERLSVGVSGGKKLPHKAILLIAIMRLIGNGNISDNKIPLEKLIADEFSLCWKKYFSDSRVPSVWTPFYHLKSEPFWHFKAADTEERLQMLLSFGGTPSVGKIRPVIKYAYFDETLFSLMSEQESRTILTEVLINTYIKQ